MNYVNQNQAAGFMPAQATQAGDACRQTEVEAENLRLAQTVEHLCMVAETLTGRLTPVRRQTGNLASSKNDPSTPEPVLCELATTTRIRRQSVEHAIGILQVALNELEI